MSKTIEQAAEEYYREFPHNPADKTDWTFNKDVHCFKKRKAFIAGAKSEAAKEYWYRQFEAEKVKAKIDENKSILEMAKHHLDSRALFVLNDRIKSLEEQLKTLENEKAD